MAKLINIKEAAEYTGISIATLYRMVNQRRVPYVKVCRLLKFNVELLDKWIEERTLMPIPLKKAV